MSEPVDFDFIVVGAGPAGQNAALEAARAGQRVLLVERDSKVGGECVHRGTIPSKTLRESASFFASLRQRGGDLGGFEVRGDTKVRGLMQRLEEVLSGHEQSIRAELLRNQVELWHGSARFSSAHTLDVSSASGMQRSARARFVILATGSRPRRPAEVPIDHDLVLDSDSILSQIYLPASLTVLGAGVIACEFASVFQALGVQVTMLDKSSLPLAFLDPELSTRFLRSFEAAGGRYIAGDKVLAISSDSLSGVQTRLESGEQLHTEKLLCALGRVANLGSLGLEQAGLAANARGHLPVDENMRTAVEHIYAAGDVSGPPALAASSMEQGRRAVRHALCLNLGPAAETTPVGIYTLPELAYVGLTEAQARERHGEVLVGRVPYERLARGQISGEKDGFLKLIADAQGEKLLGVHVIGGSATELVHLGQLAMIAGLSVNTFVDNIFNFPTLAEAYRVAALEIAYQGGTLRATPLAA